MQKLLLLFSWLYGRKSSRTGLEIQKWKVTDEYIFKAILNFALDCFILQIIYLLPTHKNHLLHYQLVRLIKCVPGRHVPCRISMFMDWKKHHFANGHLLNWWAKCGSSSNFISRHSIHMDTELLIKIHNVYLQYATGRDPLRSHSASGYSFLLSENCLLSAD